MNRFLEFQALFFACDSVDCLVVESRVSRYPRLMSTLVTRLSRVVEAIAGKVVARELRDCFSNQKCVALGANSHI